MRYWTQCRLSTVKILFRGYAASAKPALKQVEAVARLLDNPTDYENQGLAIRGYVRSLRKQKRLAFASLDDGSSLKPLQAILRPETAEKISIGDAVSVLGTLVQSRGSEQSHEIRVDEVHVLGENDVHTHPIQNKFQTSEFLRTIPHLRSRTATNQLLLRLRSQLISSLTAFFAKYGYVQTQPPIITSSDCEGAGEVFQVAAQKAEAPAPGSNASDEESAHYFKDPKYLTVSSQLHLEALAQSVGKVWAISPTFRAERSDTARHLSEFYMLEAELAFSDDLSDIMDLVEAMLRHVTSDLMTSRVGRELRENTQNQEHAEITALSLHERWQGVISEKWPRIAYRKAVEIIQAAVRDGSVAFDHDVDERSGLQTEHERYLAVEVGRGSPVFVTDYPAAIKPFYMAPSKNTQGDAPTVACFDLLVPGLCEIAGGSMREHRHRELIGAMEEKRVNAHNLEWYVDLRRYGSVPHGGFGLGFDRLVCYLSGTSNVRDVVTFPRWYGRCSC